MQKEFITCDRERLAPKAGGSGAGPQTFLSAGLCGFEDAMRQAEPVCVTMTIFQNDRNYLNQGITLAGRFGDRERPAMSNKQ
jgi:hypothetical protein